MSKLKLQKWIVITVMFGLFYTNWELFLRAFGGELLGVENSRTINNLAWASLAGWTSIWMVFVGGMAGFLIGLLNENSAMRQLKMWQLSLLGMVLVFIVEYFSGLLFNRVFGLALWDYSHHWGNLSGQISIRYAPVWFLAVPVTMWFDDMVRFYIFSEEKPAPFLRYYRFNHSLACNCCHHLLPKS